MANKKIRFTQTNEVTLQVQIRRGADQVPRLEMRVFTNGGIQQRLEPAGFDEVKHLRDVISHSDDLIPVRFGQQITAMLEEYGDELQDRRDLAVEHLADLHDRVGYVERNPL